MRYLDQKQDSNSSMPDYNNRKSNHNNSSKKEMQGEGMYNGTMLSIINEHLSAPLAMLSPLIPDHRASSYQLNYSHYQSQKLSSHLSQNQTHQLLCQLEEARTDLLKANGLGRQKDIEHAEKTMLLKMEVERLRTIMREQGEQLEQVRKEWLALEGVYLIKLEELKLTLEKQFQDELQSTKQQSVQLLQQTKSIYVSKMSALTQSYELQLGNKSKQIEQLNKLGLNNQVVQIREKDYELRIDKLKTQNQRLNLELNQLRRQIKQERLKGQAKYHNQANIVHINDHHQSPYQNGQLRKENLLQKNISQIIQQQALSLHHEQLYNKNSQLSSDIEEIKRQNNSLNQQLFQLRMKSNLAQPLVNQQMTILNRDLERANVILKSKQDQLQRLKLKCHKLQKELEEFKNRKTQGLITSPNEMATGKKLLHINQPQLQSRSLFFSNIELMEQSNTGRQNIDQIRKQTEERISYQQSLKKLHQMELKLHETEMKLNEVQMKNQHLNNDAEQLQQELKNKDQQLQQRSRQVNNYKRLMAEKQTIIKSLSQNQKKQGTSNYLAIITQKDEQINELNHQLETKNVVLNKLQKEVEKNLKQIERASKRQKDLQAKLLEAEENCLNKLKLKDNQVKAKDAEIKAKDNELKARQNQMKLKDAEIKTNETQIKLKQNQLRNKQNELRSKEGQVRNKDNQIKIKDSELRNKDIELKAKQAQLKSKQSQLKSKAQSLAKLQEELNHSKEQHRKQSQVKPKQSTQPVLSKSFNQSIKSNPFSQPLIQDQCPLPLMSSPLVSNQQKQLSLISLQEYESKLSQLQKIVQQLQFQWGQTEQAQNNIFTYIKGSYTDQIKLLTLKNEQSEKNAVLMNEMLEAMGKKQTLSKKK